MKFCIIVLLKISLVMGGPLTASGQAAKFLPVPQFKLLYADTLYNDAIARKDTDLLAEAYYLYGKSYRAAGDIEAGQKWYLKAFQLLKPRGDSPGLSRLYYKFADGEIPRDYKKALQWIREGLAMAKRVSSNKFIYWGNQRLAEIHSIDWSEAGKKPDLPKQNLDSARYYLHQRKVHAIEVNDSLGLAEAYVATAHFRFRLFNDAKAMESGFKMALSIHKKRHDDGGQIDVLYPLIKFYFARKQYEPARKALEEVRQILDRYDYFNNGFSGRGEFVDLYAEYYRQTGKWKDAAESMKELRQIELATYSTESQLAYSRLTQENEKEKKDVELKAKDKELAIRSEMLLAQKRFTITSLMLLIVTAGMSLVFYRLYKKNQKINAQNELLVKEQNHRVKNNLQAISSILSLQSDILTDPGALKAIEESRLRVETMAILHRKLYDGNQLAKVFMPDFIEELTEGVLHAYGFENVALEVKADAIHLSADHAVHIGLILNELITNSCKYAFPKHDCPKLCITCIRYYAWSQKHIKLIVADNGPGFTNTKNDITGFGMSLIKMETEQLYAKYTFVNEGGTRFSMDFQESSPEPTML
ncbi:histidine kinase dimerization/phosphoacceptor domain -containing protein [Dyadobacter sp. LHD-138]|uniref:histidine kinase dimerization/phosphoacceptor domain -containing protein n=1 Tax=Dyadobacter sp. LHD-138 TaxID=3071413 RepID=UPI0027DF3B67|nr:histidine kinase dimerization/phosphoacceptor domain -containing protein [Dyadobacter sp. LHD-138]MDQ6481916.1 histidine kinase dimerization/phosphoacceptor domain -containing protein [Dyadobacter sp. LHD-138]